MAPTTEVGNVKCACNPETYRFTLHADRGVDDLCKLSTGQKGNGVYFEYCDSVPSLFDPINSGIDKIELRIKEELLGGPDRIIGQIWWQPGDDANLSYDYDSSFVSSSGALDDIPAKLFMEATYKQGNLVKGVYTATIGFRKRVQNPTTKSFCRQRRSIQDDEVFQDLVGSSLDGGGMFDAHRILCAPSHFQREQASDNHHDAVLDHRKATHLSSSDCGDNCGRCAKSCSTMAQVHQAALDAWSSLVQPRNDRETVPRWG